MREGIARRAAALLLPGWVVNLGIGIPTLVPKYLPAGSIHLHTENGLLEVGPPPEPGRVDPNLVDAGKRPVTELTGASFFDSASSFAMIRGGHIDATILGALQVDEAGRIANWAIPGEPVLGVGGAMDLLCGVRNVIVLMTQTTKEGAPKIVRECSLPLTSLRPADWILTEIATFRMEGGRMRLVSWAPGVTPDEIRAKTGAHFDMPAPGEAPPLPGGEW